MKALRHETPDVAALADRMGGATAASFLARHRKHVGKTIYLRALAPAKPGDTLGEEALGPISVATGDKFETAQAVEPGQVFTAIKSDHLNAGHLYDATELAAPEWYKPLSALFR